MAEEKKKQAKGEGSPAYEELLEMYNRLKAEVMDKRRMENLGEITARLNFLFKVVENHERFPGDYLNGCVEDIMRIMPCGGEDGSEGKDA